MRKMLFSVFAVLAVLGCGGDDGDLPPCLTCSINKCGGRDYNPSTQFCSGGTVYSKSSSSVWSSSSFAPLVMSSSSFAMSSSSSSSSSVPSSSSFVRSSKGNNISSYRTVKIGDQVWMAENLDYAVNGSKCYSNEPANCVAYGSLYDWATIMGFASGCNYNSCSSQIQSPHRGICPVGWHIPNDDDWNVLVNYVGGSSTAGKHLKAKSGWDSCGPYGSGSSYSCEDTYGFSALPGGEGNPGGWFVARAGNWSNSGLGSWWSASEYNSSIAYFRGIEIDYDGVFGGGGDNNTNKGQLLSVRCLQDGYEKSSSSVSSSSSLISSSSSSSSSSAITFACTMTATTGTVGTAISPVPTATCNGSAVTTGLTWTPANYTPSTSGRVSVSVSASSGVCSGMTAQCGNITVSPTFACTMTAKTGTVGTAISPVPTATCNGSSVTTGLAWTPANYTPSTSGNISVSVSASSGVCSGMTAQCGSVTVSPPTFACTMTAKTGTAGTAISPVPTATCNGSNVTTGLAWTPANYTPSTSGNISVSVSASSGVCSGMTAQCGSVTVSPTFACTMTAKTGTVGTAISPVPTATCNGSNVTTGLTWTPANYTPSTSGNVSVSVSASSGVCSGMTAQCGSVTVSPPTFACTMTATTGTVGTAISPVPTATCNGSNVPTGLTWTPTNYTPSTSGSVAVSVSASSGVCSGMTAQCGSLTVSPPTLACTMTATTGTMNRAISPAPTATCNGSAVTTGLAWTPTNYTPSTSGNVSVSVSASSGVCSGMTAQCGNITVSPTFACTMTAKTGTVGTAISPVPTATCNGSSVTTGLAWTPTNYTPSTSGNVPVSVSASSGVCSGMTAQCGNITISPTFVCTMTAKTGTVGTAISPVPTATCNGSSVTTGLAWTPANYTPSTSGNVAVSVSASSGVCNGMTAQCGNVTVYSGKGNNISNYRTVVIGTQTWMAENLDYVVEGSKCYNNNPARCTTYGSLYKWATAMNLPSSCNSNSCSSQIQSKHRGICPSGWHIPSQAEWNTLSSYVQGNSGCSSCDARLLKATSGWNSGGNGTDQYGFSALPGGRGPDLSGFSSVGDGGVWWSTSESELSSYYASYQYMNYGNDYARLYSNGYKYDLFSVRCVQD